MLNFYWFLYYISIVLFSWISLLLECNKWILCLIILSKEHGKCASSQYFVADLIIYWALIIWIRNIWDLGKSLSLITHSNCSLLHIYFVALFCNDIVVVKDLGRLFKTAARKDTGFFSLNKIFSQKCNFVAVVDVLLEF